VASLRDVLTALMRCLSVSPNSWTSLTRGDNGEPSQHVDQGDLEILSFQCQSRHQPHPSIGKGSLGRVSGILSLLWHSLMCFTTSSINCCTTSWLKLNTSCCDCRSRALRLSYGGQYAQ